MPERARRPVDSVAGVSMRSLRFADGVDRALLLRWGYGERSVRVSFSSSSQISSDSVMPFLRGAVMLKRSLFFVVGVRGSVRKGEEWPLAASSSVLELGVSVSASESLRSFTKPMPGVKGFWVTGGLVVGSLLRRHERASTPRRRIMVPRAIW